MRFALIGFLVLVTGVVVKAHMVFIKLALVAAMGLMGMWMMHKLAQDWHKISTANKPAMMAGKLLGLWKRSIPDAVSLQHIPVCLSRYYTTILSSSF